MDLNIIGSLNLINKKNGKPSTHTIRFWESQFNQLKPTILRGNRRYYSNKDVEKIIQSNDGEGVLIHRDHTKGLLVRGYKENDFQKLNLVKNKNFEGNKKLHLKHISIGEELSINLNLKIGDKILIMSPSGIETLVGNFPKQQTFIISSIFSSDLNEPN